MSRWWIGARAALAAAPFFFAGGLLPAAAGGVYPVAAYYPVATYYMSCGARLDYCVPICDAMVPGGLALGRCYDRCSIGAGICEASRIPVPGRRARR